MANQKTSKSAKKSKPTPPSKQGNAKKATEKKSQQLDSAAQKKKEKVRKIAKSEVITLAVMNRARLDDLGKDNQIQDQKAYFQDTILKGWFGQFSDVSDGKIPQTPINISTPDTIPVNGEDGTRRWGEVAKNQVLRNLNSAIMKARAKNTLKFPRSAWEDDHFDPAAFLN